MNPTETTVAQVIERLKKFPPDAIVRVLEEELSGGVSSYSYEGCDLRLSFYSWKDGDKTYVDIGNT